MEQFTPPNKRLGGHELEHYQEFAGWRRPGDEFSNQGFEPDENNEFGSATS